MRSYISKDDGKGCVVQRLTRLPETSSHQGVGFPHDVASNMGDDFLSNLTAIIFPLNNNVWQALNDKHNRDGVAPEQEFADFFGKRVYSKKADRPNYGFVLHHLHEVWIGTNDVVKQGNWPVVACNQAKAPPLAD